MIGNVIQPNGASGGGGINYSTTEQDTGLKWIDGKSIYQKTVQFSTNNSQGTKVYPTGITAYDVISVDNMIAYVYENKTYSTIAPTNGFDLVTAQTSSGHNSEITAISKHSNDLFNSVTVYATISYTKS